DDGAADPAESQAMLDGLADLGYLRVAATPHHHHALFDTVSALQIAQGIAGIEEQRAGRPPRLVPGAEIWFDEHVFDPGAADALPGFGASRILLMEFGGQPGSPPRGFETLVFKLALRSAHVVIAHPERYPAIQRDPGRLEPLRRAGALIQVNLLSLVGRYGSAPRAAVWKLLESGAADVAATDLHRAADLPNVARALDELARWDPAEFVRLVSANPAAILDGKPEAVSRRE
ncbi:MAG TPA: CpsB/CapC family capsule biosynthesis tyrosine phosphatase, partial [Polyangia bacterium]|nr:CpsB/CapC family capsule biosynthesis tyrosine phosphatase [Polyangia bacterium]